MDIHGNSVANTCEAPARVAIVELRTNRVLPYLGITATARIVFNDSSFQLLTYQLLSVRYWLTEAVTGNGELGFDSGEGA
jgi:hypothetical protein